MNFSAKPNLDGLRAALALELSGLPWHQFDQATAPAPADDVIQSLYNQICDDGRFARRDFDPRLVRLLVDAAAALHGERARIAGWRIIGVDPKKGRKYLSDESNMRLPRSAWVSAVSFGLGFVRHNHPRDYAPDDHENQD